MNLNEPQRAEIRPLENMTDGDIDYTDFPEVKDLSGFIHGAYHLLRSGAGPPRRADVTENGPEGPLEGAPSTDAGYQERPIRRQSDEGDQDIPTFPQDDKADPRE